MTFWASLIFIIAASLEVGGDALVRQGLRKNGWTYIVAGCLVLSGYGVAVNMVRWDFSKLMGAYVAVFALVSVLTGRFLLKEHVPTPTWIGLTLILAGGLVIQLGTKAP